MNKAKLLEQLQALKENETYNECQGVMGKAIELVEQLTCIIDPTFPTVIKEPVPLRDYGVLYLVLDGSDERYYITRQDDWLYRFDSDTKALKAWELAINKHYPETRESK